MVVNEIMGMDEGFFWSNIGFISVYVMIAFYIFFGIKFMNDGLKADKKSAQREYFIGLGLFIISVAIGEGLYLSDLVVREYLGVRLFLPLSETSSGAISWQELVGYEIASLMDRDYYIISFTFVIIALSFLMKPLEKIMLKREKLIFTYLNRIMIPLPLLIRVLEVNLGWLGIPVTLGSIPFFIFSILWIIVLGVIIISILTLLGLYLKMGLDSPKGSSLRKKSFLIIIGILFWIVAVFTTSTIFNGISDGNWYYVPIVPLFQVLSLSCLMHGFKREF